MELLQVQPRLWVGVRKVFWGFPWYIPQIPENHAKG